MRACAARTGARAPNWVIDNAPATRRVAQPALCDDDAFPQSQAFVNAGTNSTALSNHFMIRCDLL